MSVQQIIGPFGWAFWFAGASAPPVVRAYPSRFRTTVTVQPGKVDPSRTAVIVQPGKVDPSKSTASDL